MKKKYSVYAIILIVFFAASCGSKQEKTQEEKEQQEEEGAYEAPGVSSEQLIADGKALVDQNDCRTCHHPTNKVIGPAHTEVAKKYDFTEANIKMLAEKIIKGGKGNWGDIVMNPHPDLSQENAEKMARYVLSLDGEKEK